MDLIKEVVRENKTVKKLPVMIRLQESLAAKLEDAKSNVSQKKNKSRFFYLSKSKHSNERSVTRLKTESETGERRYGHVRLARFCACNTLTPSFTDFLTESSL